MASTSVRFEFKCGLHPIKSLIEFHPLHSTFIRPDALQTLARNVALQQPFYSGTDDILQAYESALLPLSNQECPVCGAPSTVTLSSIHPFLHIVSEPRVEFTVVGHASQLQPEKEDQETEISNTYRCGEVEGVRFCNRCKVVAYCGKEHQKADWEVHKRVCA